MTTTMTARDKKLLAMLGVICVASALIILVILPLLRNNQDITAQCEENEFRITQMQQKEVQLTAVQKLNQEQHEQLEEMQTDIFPMLRIQDVDQLLTQKVLAHGLAARKLQIIMPDGPANVMPFGSQEEEGSNPDGKTGVWIAVVNLETSGADGAMDQLIDDLSVQTPGVRITSVSWGKGSRTVDQTTGAMEQYGVLSMQLQVLMSERE